MMVKNGWLPEAPYGTALRSARQVELIGARSPSGAVSAPRPVSPAVSLLLAWRMNRRDN